MVPTLNESRGLDFRCRVNRGARRIIWLLNALAIGVAGLRFRCRGGGLNRLAGKFNTAFGSCSRPGSDGSIPILRDSRACGIRYFWQKSAHAITSKTRILLRFFIARPHSPSTIMMQLYQARQRTLTRERGQHRIQLPIVHWQQRDDSRSAVPFKRPSSRAKTDVAPRTHADEPNSQQATR